MQLHRNQRNCFRFDITAWLCKTITGIMPNDANEGDNADALSQWQAQNDGSDEWMQWSVSLTTDKKGAMLDLDIGIILQTFRRITL